LIDPTKQAFLAGASFEGVWTLPVCDVGSNPSWIANDDAGFLPCCCGINCNQTQEFQSVANMAGNKAVNAACAKQFSGYKATSGANFRPQPFAFTVWAVSIWVVSFASSL